MNPWPIYSHMKVTWARTGHIPTKKEIDLAFPHKTEEERAEGIVEFYLTYDRSLSKENHDVPEWVDEAVNEIWGDGA